MDFFLLFCSCNTASRLSQTKNKPYRIPKRHRDHGYLYYHEDCHRKQRDGQELRFTVFNGCKNRQGNDNPERDKYPHTFPLFLMTDWTSGLLLPKAVQLYNAIPNSDL